jgi:hypothetical protein
MSVGDGHSRATAEVESDFGDEAGCPLEQPVQRLPGGLEIGAWADRVRTIDARYVGTWELPAIGTVSAPTAVLIRPDGMWLGWETWLSRDSATR